MRRSGWRRRVSRGLPMDWDDIVLPFALIAILGVAAFAMALKSLLDGGPARAELARLSDNYRALDARLAALLARFDQLAAPGDIAAAPAEPPISEPLLAAVEPIAPSAAPREPVTPQPAASPAMAGGPRWDW